MQKLKMKTRNAHLPSCHPMLYTVSVLRAPLSNPPSQNKAFIQNEDKNGILSYIASFRYEEMAKCSHFDIRGTDILLVTAHLRSLCYQLM
jgi:hypothetical protein